ncbi:hypothetical protein PC121_g10880 [Phytophthora cactorum]|nr:hypothetical protein PC120_g8730 [Phytophthora cactorum]KAG3066337.1 hypothetical protein PC121_g10880 [Phytophthora cactorum]
MSEDEATSTRAHLSGDDYRIVSWMEDKKNFDAINGYKGKTSVGGKPKRKQLRWRSPYRSVCHRLPPPTPRLP